MSNAMLKSIVSVTILCATLVFAGLAGAAEAGTTKKSPGQTRFERCDTDKNGFWSKEEYKACAKRVKPENVDKRFGLLDTDKDSTVSKAEWEAAKAKRAEKRAAKRAAKGANGGKAVKGKQTSAE